MPYALLTPDLSAVEAYPVTIDQAREAYPEIRGVSMSRPDPTLYPRLVEIVEVAPPAVGFGEAIEASAEKVDGVVRQAWTVRQSITLGAAKQRLAQMAVEVYWAKMQAVPTPQEIQAEGGYAGVMQAREARFNPKLANVRARIQAAAAMAAARAILAELEELA